MVYNTIREILNNDQSEDVTYKTKSDKIGYQATLTKEDIEDFRPKILSEQPKVILKAKWIKEVEQAINQTTTAGDDEVVNITKEKFTHKLKIKKELVVTR